MTDLVRRESEFLLYTTSDGAVKVDVLFRDETVWLTQKTIAELFGVGVPGVNKHLKNIFESGELDRGATISKMEMVRSEGARDVARVVDFYNRDAIIAVGYRVNSYDWATFLNSFLELSNYPIITDNGKVSALEAKLKAEGEYEVYRKRQDADFISDFDRVVAETQRPEGGGPEQVPSPTKAGKGRRRR